ncbi:cytochrome P450 [Leucosporidium creatinivorum]|uniref:Cytochrome P450 n=1 Tax=Leucosporidium creatinivorum TaxID=106004 RepID=A0A1Y2EY34_9BASI|nr:cytochrome P450 [Leucosporidium creatinivorum]
MLLLGLALCTLLLLLRTLYRFFLSPLSSVPGPNLAKVSRLWKVGRALDGTIMSNLFDLHEKLGPLVRIGPNEVSVRSADDISLLYGFSTKFYKAGDYYDAWKPPIPVKHPGHFPTLDPAVHAKYRRPVAGVYAMRQVLASEEYVEGPVSDLLLLLDDAAEAGKPFDIGAAMHYFAYEVVFELAFGGSLGFLKKGEDIGLLIDSLHAVTKFGHVKGQLPSGCKQLLSTPAGRRFSRWVTKSVWGHKGDPNVIWETASQRVATRWQEREDGKPEGRKDFLSAFMEATDPDTGKRYSQFYVTLEAMDMLVGYYCKRTSSRPLSAHGEPASASTCPSRDLGDARRGSHHLPAFLCLSRQARVHPGLREGGPSAHHGDRRYTPSSGPPGDSLSPDGAVIAETFLPGGTIVGMSAFVTHTDFAAFGPTARQYKPERWLSVERGELEKKLLTFGAGTRVCIGKNVSLVEMAKLIPTIIHNYDLSFATTEKWRVWEGWFNGHSDFLVNLQRRDV